MSSEDNAICFPCSLFHRKKTKRVHSQTDKPPPLRKSSEESNKDRKNEEKSFAPSKKAYAFEVTKKTIELLKNASNLTPIPLAKDVLELGLTILSICEKVGEVQERVSELRNRVGEYMLVIAKFMKDKGENEVLKRSEDLRDELEELKTCLQTVEHHLQDLISQNQIFTAIFTGTNIAAIEECEKIFQRGIDKFQTLRDLHAAQDLALLQAEVEGIYGLAKQMAAKLGTIETKVDSMREEMQAIVEDRNSVIIKHAPKLPKFFRGRDENVEQIAEDITSGDPSRTRVCILGPGGMGKTSTALAVMRHKDVQARFAPQRRYWVPCTSANSLEAFLSILCSVLNVSSKTDDPLTLIIAALEASSEPRILLLDNFETPWQSTQSKQDGLKIVIQELNALEHVAILLTMRSGFSPLEEWNSHKLDVLKAGDAQSLYIAIDAGAEPCSELHSLLDALGYLPYANTLMATRGKKSLSTPAQLLMEWKERGTAMLSRTKSEGMDYCIGISVDSPFVSNTPGAISLLQVLSMLPAGTYRSHIGWWLPIYRADAIETLREAALVLVSDQQPGSDVQTAHLFVLPVVQRYMQMSRPDNELRLAVYHSCWKSLKTFNSVTTGPNDGGRFKKDITEISTEEVNIRSLLTDAVRDWRNNAEIWSQGVMKDSTPSLTILLNSLLVFAWYQCWTKPQKDLICHLISIAEKLGDSQTRAEGLFCLGAILFRLDDYLGSLDAFRQAMELYQSFKTKASDIRALECEIGAFRSELEVTVHKNELRETIFLRVNDTKEFCIDNPILPRAWLLLKAEACFLSGDSILCNSILEHADTEVANWSKTIEEADGFYHRARCLAKARQYQEAICLMDQAIESYKTLGVQAHDSAIFTTLVKARFLRASNSPHTEILSVLELALERARGFGGPLATILTLQLFGDVHVDRKDYPAARVAYEAALKAGSVVKGYTTERAVRICKYNLEIINGLENGCLPEEKARFRYSGTH